MQLRRWTLLSVVTCLPMLVAGCAGVGSPDPREGDSVATAAAFFHRVERGDGDAARGLVVGSAPEQTDDDAAVRFYADHFSFPEGDCDLADDWKSSQHRSSEMAIPAGVVGAEPGDAVDSVTLRLECDGRAATVDIAVVPDRAMVLVNG